jgi:hypothetical protein
MAGPGGPNYEFPDNPVYTTDIPSLDNNDPASASDVFNPWIFPIIGNIHAVKQGLDSLLAQSFFSEGGVHGMRFFEGRLEYWNGLAWGAIQTGTSTGLGPVKSLDIDSDTSSLIIYWEDPDDLTVSDVPVSRWVSTTLVRKDSGYPLAPDDGVLVVVNNVRDQFAAGYTDSGLTDGQTYYYRLFSLSDSGKIDTYDANIIHGTAGYNPFAVPAEEWAFNDGTGNISVFVKLPRFRISDVIAGSTNNNWHPAFIVNGNVVNHIWIGKFQANIVGGRAYARTGVLPSVTINFDNSKAACDALGAGHHMITNVEWAAVALWCKARGFQPEGNNSSSAAVVSGGTNPAWYHNNHLSGIEHLNGNVWEWCGGLRLNAGEINIIPDNNAAVTGADHSASSPLWRAIMPDGTLVAPGTAGTLRYTQTSAAFSDVTTTPTATGAGAELLQTLCLIPEPGLVSGDYGDDWFWSSLTGERIPLRGGSWYDESDAGVFALGLDYARTSAGTGIGFRSAYIEPL